MPGLPINLDDLIRGTICEDFRREFTAGWNEYIRDSVVRTVSAFANDLPNLNGGYVVLGIEDDVTLPVHPQRPQAPMYRA